MSRLVVAAMVLLLTVGGLFGAAAWNRGGDVQTIVLSERELALPWSWPSASGGTRLRFEWQSPSEPQDGRVWLTEMKLRELGFAMDVPAGAPEAEHFYGRNLPRLASVAFEMDGPAWRAFEQRLAMATAANRFQTRPGDRSHLVPVDAAPHPDALRRRYQGQPVVVLPAIIRLRYRTTATEGPSVWGEVTELVAGEVTVPPSLRHRLPAGARRAVTPPDPSGVRPTELEAPRYTIELRVGRLGTPWVHDIRPLPIAN
jgi:hypothetical protein